MAAMVEVLAVPTEDLLSGTEWSPTAIGELFRLSHEVKAHPERFRHELAGRSVALIFEKPSLRTRVTFEVGVQNLGGSVVFLDQSQSRLGQRECIKDMARSLEGWVQAIVARTFEQSVLEEMAHHASIPIINALSERYHPCQALADFFTLEERFGRLRGFPMAYVGDGNNMCHSLMIVAARLGVRLRVATPLGYEPEAEIVAEARRTAAAMGGRIELFNNAAEAVRGAQAVYTDVWASMGQESEAAARAEIFEPFQVNESLMAWADRDAVFMHCLPAHRGQEVAASVIDSGRAVVYQQAENRLHVQNAIMLTLIH